MRTPPKAVYDAVPLVTLAIVMAVTKIYRAELPLLATVVLFVGAIAVTLICWELAARRHPELKVGPTRPWIAGYAALFPVYISFPLEGRSNVDRWTFLAATLAIAASNLFPVEKRRTSLLWGIGVGIGVGRLIDKLLA